MPVRSITVKLIVPRKTEGLPEARNLWTTHEAVNRAVAYYESILLEMRCDPYLYSDDRQVRVEDVTAVIDQRIRDACRHNGRNEDLSFDELSDIRKLLRSLYEAIVPSSIGERGDAQQANAYISPLTDPESTAFQSVFEKIGGCPEWLEGVRKGDIDAFFKAGVWLETDEGKARMTATGAPPKWVRLARKNDDNWKQAFVVDYDHKLKEVEGVPTIFRKLREHRVIPLFDAYLAPRIEGAQGNVSPWDRLAFRLAVGHLMSWESWCRISAEDHAKRIKRLDEFESLYLNREENRDAVQALRGYEQERTAELSKMGLGPVNFRIRSRMVRSWDDLREKWVHAKDKTPEKLLAISADMQTKLKGRFGDPHLFAWLAKPEHHSIWNTSQTDVVKLVAHANALKGLLERSRESAAMTLPDPVLHPRCAQWEAEGGSNLKTYKLFTENGKLSATLPLLHTKSKGTYKEVLLSLPVAPTSQLQNPVIENSGSITYQNQAEETFSGILRSTDLLFDWSYFQHRPVDKLSSGDIGAAYLKLVIDIAPKLPAGWTGKRAGFVNHFISALGNEKYAHLVEAGSRILSVDLGLRCFASCSVFELRDRHPGKGKLCYGAGDSLWAVHERSFMLRIPGEQVDSRGEEWRRLAKDELRRLRRSLVHYRSFYRMTHIEDELQRQEPLNSIIAGLEESGGGLPFEMELFKGLNAQTSLPQDLWAGACESARNLHKIETGKVIREWRRRTRKRDPLKAMGKSIWAIEYLSDVRRFLVGWSLLGNATGEISRLDRERRGVFARRLLQHIDGIKSDRLKTGADLIVQAARGYIRDTNGKWQKKYAPCHAILFEDLSRYRMKTDRPRRENSQLMRWAHRQMPAEVQLQGELYGIHTCDTSAAFSSRFHAATLTPGVRCKVLTVEDIKNPWLRQKIEQEAPSIDWSILKTADIVPESGGELFAFLGNGGIILTNADINAAQNLQHRFWTRHETPIRIPCRTIKVDGEERWLPRSMGKRLKGAMGGFGWMVPTRDSSGSCKWETLTAKQWKSLGGPQGEDEPSLPNELFDAEGFEESILETSGEVVVFFRDPSGEVLPKHFWFPSKHFWGVVKTRTTHALMRLHSAKQAV